jgi:hypothetical protein
MASGIREPGAKWSLGVRTLQTFRRKRTRLICNGLHYSLEFVHTNEGMRERANSRPLARLPILKLPQIFHQLECGAGLTSCNGGGHWPATRRVRSDSGLTQVLGEVLGGEGMSATATRPDSSDLLRKLHSLTGLVPVSAFLAEHFWSNSAALVSRKNTIWLRRS